ncbi:MAG: GIY-YIG nuclease family protein, partial [Actinomycetota bacterium]|nr:GIY-YIG nuclease family protein [Actinomycetota bacterium]MEC7291383.1 GIY-YIG nuclease family protein [Pseudomonadota bacterium]
NVMTDKRYVYVIGPEKHRSGMYTKIGIAKDPEERLKALDTGHPAQLHIHHLHGPTTKFFEIEKRAHTMLHNQRGDGEWFKVSPREAIRTVKKAAKADRAMSWFEVLVIPALTTAAVVGALAAPFILMEVLR